jgi:hypothetical protein
MDATRVNQILGMRSFNLVSRCFTLFTNVNCAGGGMHLQFDACVSMTYQLVRSVILTFGLYVNHELR